MKASLVDRGSIRRTPDMSKWEVTIRIPPSYLAALLWRTLRQGIVINEKPGDATRCPWWAKVDASSTEQWRVIIHPLYRMFFVCRFLLGCALRPAT